MDRETPTFASPWAAIAWLERAEVDAWRVENFPSLPMSDALANNVKRIETQLSRRINGNSLVTVSILGRESFRSRSNAFFLQTAGRRTRIGPDKPSTTA